MQSSLIGKIEKAHRYAEEPDRFHIDQLTCTVRGDNSTHTVTISNDAWRCDCLFFRDHRACSHTMALERLFGAMLPAAAAPAAGG